MSKDKNDCSGPVKGCYELLKAADEVITAKEKQILIYKGAIQNQQLFVQNLNERLMEAQAEKDKWYRNPYLMTALGLLAGGALVYGVSK